MGILADLKAAIVAVGVVLVSDGCNANRNPAGPDLRYRTLFGGIL